MPRALTNETRTRLGLLRADNAPYRWGFAALVVALAAAPLLVAGYVRFSIALALFALGAVPSMRWLAKRDAERWERVYQDGEETRGLVIAVEPGGDRTGGRIVRVEYLVSGERVKASILGCPLARKGLGPGDEVRIVYDPTEPQRCLIAERTRRAEAAVE